MEKANFTTCWSGLAYVSREGDSRADLGQGQGVNCPSGGLLSCLPFSCLSLWSTHMLSHPHTTGTSQRHMLVNWRKICMTDTLIRNGTCFRGLHILFSQIMTSYNESCFLIYIGLNVYFRDLSTLYFFDEK